MLWLKYETASLLFDFYLFDKKIYKYNKFDWFLYKWCFRVFGEYYAYIVNK